MNPLLILSYYEDVWIDLDMLPTTKADIFAIVKPQLARPADLSNSRLYVTFENVGRVNVWHKIMHSIKFYLMLPYLAYKHKIFLFIAPPYFHSISMPLLKLFGKKLFTVSGDAYSEIARESLWQASKMRVLMRKIFYPLYLLSEYLGIKPNDKVFGVSDYLVEKYARWTKAELAPNGAPVNEITKIKPSMAVKGDYIYYVGGILKWRGIDLLINAFKLVKDKYKKSLKLVIVGGDKEEFRHYPEVMDLGPYSADIVFMGRQPHDRSISYLKSAKIAVLPNRNSLMSRTISSIKVFEYIAAEIPQVCTDSGDHAEWVRKFETGMVVKDSAQSISEGMLKLLNNDLLYSKMKQNCRKNKGKVDSRLLRKPIITAVNAAIENNK